jgi:phosphoglycolate phosphatase-like HAD superfamily hydrolase
MKTYRDLHLSEAAPRTRLFDGAAAVLADLERRGISTVLVSNKGSAGLVQLLDQLSIGERFSLVLSADRVQHRKPSGLLYDQHIADRFPTVAAIVRS